MSRDEEQLQQTLKQQGFSLTRPRLLVFRALQDREPQTMQQLVAAAGDIDRASIYRTIALFDTLGITERLQIGWKYKIELSDSFHSHHHHLTCLNCGKTIPLAADRLLESRLQQLAETASFEIQSHQLEVNGRCAQCRRAAGLAAVGARH